MMMTNDEITAAYRDAKSKREQIRILAQLNACGEDRIKEILTAAGYEMPKRTYTKRKRTEAEIAADEQRRKKAKERAGEAKEKKMTKHTTSETKAAKETATETTAETTAEAQKTVLPDEILEALTEKVISLTEQIDTMTRKAQAIRDYITNHA